MSAYDIVPDDLLERFTVSELAQVSNDTPRATTRVDAVITAKILEAEGSFHAKAAAFYVIPIVIKDGGNATVFEATMVDVRTHLLDLCAYRLLQKRPAMLNAGDKALYWSRVGKANDTWLTGLASPTDDGRVLLIGAKESTDLAPASGGAWAESDTRQTDTRSLRRW